MGRRRKRMREALPWARRRRIRTARSAGSRSRQPATRGHAGRRPHAGNTRSRRDARLPGQESAEPRFPTSPDGGRTEMCGSPYRGCGSAGEQRNRVSARGRFAAPSDASAFAKGRLPGASDGALRQRARGGGGGRLLTERARRCSARVSCASSARKPAAIRFGAVCTRRRRTRAPGYAPVFRALRLRSPVSMPDGRQDREPDGRGWQGLPRTAWIGSEWGTAPVAVSGEAAMACSAASRRGQRAASRCRRSQGELSVRESGRHAKRFAVAARRSPDRGAG